MYHLEMYGLEQVNPFCSTYHNTCLQKSTCKLCFLFVCVSLDVYLTGLKLSIGHAGRELAAFLSSLPSAVTTGMCHDHGHVPPELAMLKVYVNISCLLHKKWIEREKFVLWLSGNQMCYVGMQTTPSCFRLPNYLPEGPCWFTLTFYLLTELLASTSDVTVSSLWRSIC